MNEGSLGSGGWVLYSVPHCSSVPLLLSDVYGHTLRYEDQLELSQRRYSEKHIPARPKIPPLLGVT